jgi:hypothetical protein
VNVPPEISAGRSLPAFARSTMSLRRVFVSADARYFRPDREEERFDLLEHRFIAADHDR